MKLFLNTISVQLALRCLNLVIRKCELYHYYMAVCLYKKDDHLSSLKYLNNEKLIANHVSTYIKMRNVLISNIIDLLRYDK